MTLRDVELPAPRETALPPDVRAIIEEAETRIAAFFQRRVGDFVAGYVPSDFARVYGVLRDVVDSRLAPGDSFCEWGSGFGVVAILADRVGFSSCGIEIVPELVGEAQSLAERFGADVEFVCGTFVPPGGEDLTDVEQEFAWFEAGGADGYELLGVDADDFDVIFAYPWPGEEQIVEGIFERYAAAGALLLTFNGYEDIRLRRKRSSR